MAPDVFISYSTKDRTQADQVCAAVEEAGIGCWIAPRNISPGVEWGAAIVRAIDNCRAMILLFSASANESPQIRREVQRAVSKGVPIVPVRIEDLEPTGALAYFMEAVHWMDAFVPPFEAHLQDLVAAVATLVQPGPQTTDRLHRRSPAPPAWTVPPGAARVDRGSTTAVLNPTMTWQASGGPGAVALRLPTDATTTAVRGVRRLRPLVLAGAAALALAVAAGMAFFLTRPSEQTIVLPKGPAPVERSFKDCDGYCPVMIVIPTGSFMMGHRKRNRSAATRKVRSTR